MEKPRIDCFQLCISILIYFHDIFCGQNDTLVIDTYICSVIGNRLSDKIGFYRPKQRNNTKVEDCKEIFFCINREKRFYPITEVDFGIFTYLVGIV